MDEVADHSFRADKIDKVSSNLRQSVRARMNETPIHTVQVIRDSTISERQLKHLLASNGQIADRSPFQHDGGELPVSVVESLSE
jgi:hypothetical protein